MPDSAHRYWRISPVTGQRVRADLPLAGVLSGYEGAGFDADNPQVSVSEQMLDYITVKFQPGDTSDGALWVLPIERHASWGFGGYFAARSIRSLRGTDGKPLGQRAGFYCALRIADSSRRMPNDTSRAENMGVLVPSSGTSLLRLLILVAGIGAVFGIHGAWRWHKGNVKRARR